MATRPQTEIDALAAPPDDGGILLWPREPSFTSLIEANRRLRRSYAFPILGRTFADLVADDLNGPPIVMAGHQPAFIHPGVWAKIVVASKLAASLGAAARFLLVDSDAAPRTALTWPASDDDYCSIAGAAGPSWPAGRSYEQLPAVPKDAWRGLFNRVPERWQADPASAMPIFVRVFLDGSPAPDYVTRWISGMTAVDHMLEIASPRFVRDSELWSVQPAFAGGAASALTAHLLLHADEFWAAYNTALAAYRQRRGIRGHQHPIPDLIRDGERTEMPFWVLHDSQPRRRLFVSRAGARDLQLWAAAEPICMLSHGDLASNLVGALAACLGHWRIRPRALTLTMFARLFACDLFIHGIGGAKYDQITDEIIRQFFGVEPPAYACVSATCRLPLRTYPVTEADRASCVRLLRDVMYNPRRCLPGGGVSPAIAALTAGRANAVAESDRLRRDDPRRHAARKAAFERIRQANADLLRHVPEAIDQARRRLAEIDAQLAHNAVAGSREWFFALYPTPKLVNLREALTSSK